MFAIEYGSMSFIFRDEKSYIDWLILVFQNSQDKEQTYRNIMIRNVEVVLDLCYKNTSQQTVEPMVRALDCLQRIYGSFYDPTGFLFILQRRSS